MAILLLACARPAAPTAAPAPRAPAAPSADAAPAPGASGAAPLLQTEQWPYLAWDHAEAIVFNDLRPGPEVPLLVFDEAHGWSPHIASRAPLTLEQGERAAKLVRTSVNAEGFFAPSCHFPRFAVVLHAGTRPVGSINYTYAWGCSVVLLWPPFEHPPGSGWREVPIGNDTAVALWELRHRRKSRLIIRHARAWLDFFRDGLGLPVPEPPGPPSEQTDASSPQGEPDRVP